MNVFNLLKTASSLCHRDILNLAGLLRFVLVCQSAHAQNEVFSTKKWLRTRILVMLLILVVCTRLLVTLSLSHTFECK